MNAKDSLIIKQVENGFIVDTYQPIQNRCAEIEDTMVFQTCEELLKYIKTYFPFRQTDCIELDSKYPCETTMRKNDETLSR